MMLAAPIVLPLALAAAMLLSLRAVRLHRILAIFGTTLLTVLSIRLLLDVRTGGVVAVQMGNWPAPFGITLAADLFSAIMVVLSSLTGFAVVLFSVFAPEMRRESHGYHPLVMILLMGVNGAFLTGDAFNLYVCFEIMLMASFVLLALGGERPQIEGGVKYVALNFFSSALFLAAAGLLYGAVGTLNMADLSVKVAAAEDKRLLTAISLLFLAAFGIKAAVFPLFFWLPASYHTPAPAVSALFAGLLTKVGVYSMIRFFTLIFPLEPDFTQPLVQWIAALTMVTGVLGAAAQHEFRRILSFHIISQIGYMVLGLGLFTPLGLAGSVFYILHHIIVKTNLFLIAGVVLYARGTGELSELGGLYRSRPFLSLLFLIPAMSLAGLPPLSGFFAKLALLVAGLRVQAWALVAAALAVSLLTLFSMTKIWGEAFWKAEPDPSKNHAPPPHPALMTPIALLAGVTLVIGFFAGPLLELSLEAAEQLLNPSEYLNAVLGQKP
ncbi:MAG: Na+/H+ antiporter subunit D [Kiritimatiellae bacterium]|nr:Na+/H+ antiporter subunit D [Kiritimatiellia bacterium]MDW8459321.1 Na+/H+ antiporter subunit D [Verrucomicrobiota bacterium]